MMGVGVTGCGKVKGLKDRSRSERGGGGGQVLVVKASRKLNCIFLSFLAAKINQGKFVYI